ncbi:DUF883 family protein [Vreelandella profundi]|uniref:DUF883 family protein n=1 Tax=Vreelandella profundi TaxID=2852117 RepID=UPI001EF11678|nr:DUF883 family protein [Halomonas profundi]
MAKRQLPFSSQSDQLKDDLRHLSETVEELMNATAKDASGEMNDLRSRAERRLKDTRARLEARGERIYDETRDSLNHQADACDRYVHDNPWTSIGIGAAAGLVVGMLLGRR